MTGTALPPNVSPLERAIEELTRVTDLEIDFAALLSPERCPIEVLPFLAWHFSVDDWDEGYPETIQRAIVAASIDQHRRRGTVGAVRAALDTAGFADGDIYERGSTIQYGSAAVYGDGTTYDPGSHWAEYRVRIPRPLTDIQAAGVRALLERAAPLRCHLVELSFTRTDFVYGQGDAYGPRNYGGTQFA